MHNQSIADLNKYYNIKLEDCPADDIAVETARNGMLTYKYQTIEGTEVYIHSKYNPINEIEHVFRDMDFNRDNLFIVYGLGMGYHIDALVEKKSSASVIFVIEKEEALLRTYCKYQELEKKLARQGIFLFYGNEEQIAAAVSTKILAFNIMPLMTNIETVILPAFGRIYGWEWINRMNQRLFDVFRHAYFILGNDIEDTIIGLKNNLENVVELIKSPSIDLLRDSYSQQPAIIVSAGPSLDKNICSLKKAQGKALILATDATLNLLANNNIVPDAVFSIERIEATYQAFYKDRNIDSSITFVGPPVVRPEILNSVKGRKILALKKGEAINEWLNDLLGDNRVLPMGTSCAHICFSFARHVGADPVIFVGQDLAYSEEGVTHADGVEVKAKLNIEQEKAKYLFVEGINGQLLPTNAALKNFLVWFETEIAKDNSTRQYIDATEGGAIIKGTQVMTLEEVIQHYCDKGVTPLRDIIPAENDWLPILKKVLEELHIKKEEFYNVRQKAGKHLLALEKLEKTLCNQDKLSSKAYAKLIKTLSKANEVENLILYNRFISFFFQGLLMTTLARIKSLGNDINERSLKKNFQLQKKLFVGIVGGCFIIEKEIGYIINNLEEKASKKG